MRSWAIVGVAVLGGLAISAQGAQLSSYNFYDTGMASVSSEASGWNSHVTAGSVSIVGMNTSYSNWTGALVTDDPTIDTMDTGCYFQWSIAPAASYKMTLTSVQFGYTQSGGCNRFRLRSSKDGYSGNLYSATNVVDGVTTSYTANIAGFTDLSGGVTFRLYPYYSQFSNGYYGLADSLVVNGSVVAVPEPTFLGAAALLFPLLGRRREHATA